VHNQRGEKQDSGYYQERLAATASAQVVYPRYYQGQASYREQYIHHIMGNEIRERGSYSDYRGQQHRAAAYEHMEAYQSIGRTTYDFIFVHSAPSFAAAAFARAVFPALARLAFLATALAGAFRSATTFRHFKTPFFRLYDTLSGYDLHYTP